MDRQLREAALQCNCHAPAGKIPVNLTGQIMVLRDFAQAHTQDMESL
ncbi:MAG TPA: hypothetical protein VIM35_04945 [Gallionella sp.]